MSIRTLPGILDGNARVHRLRVSHDAVLNGEILRFPVDVTTLVVHPADSVGDREMLVAVGSDDSIARASSAINLDLVEEGFNPKVFPIVEPVIPFAFITVFCSTVAPGEYTDFYGIVGKANGGGGGSSGGGGTILNPHPITLKAATVRSLTSVTVGASSTPLIAANSLRKGGFIQNCGDTDLFISPTDPATSDGICLAPKGSYPFNGPAHFDVGAWWGIRSSVGSVTKVAVFEIEI